MEKKFFESGRHWFWDTSWLGRGFSCSENDFIVSGKAGKNWMDFKHRSAILNKCQLDLFLDKKIGFHIVAHFSSRQNSFESNSYKIYCPHDIKYDGKIFRRTERGWLIDEPTRVIGKEEAKSIFRGDTVWPCCGRTSF